jgi:hypothetical protein
MSEQENTNISPEGDVEGHSSRWHIDGSEAEDDVEGHARVRADAPAADDVEGHRIHGV